MGIWQGTHIIKGEVMQEINKSRGYQVVKHNDLIQKAKYNLTTNQQKFIAYVISLIKPTDKDFTAYEISVSDFCELCGVDRNHFYTEFRDLVLDLDKKSFWFETDTEAGIFRWFSEVIYYKKKGKIKIRLHSCLKKYLLELYGHYTQYELYNILAIKGKYTIRLYELFKSYFYTKGSKHESITLSVDELKKLLMAESYTDYRNFRQRVIEPGLKEINDYTDLTVSFVPIKTGKTITDIAFNVRVKEFPSNYAAYIKTIERLNKKNGQFPGQMSLWDLPREDFESGSGH